MSAFGGKADIALLHREMSVLTQSGHQVILLNHFVCERNEPSWNGQAQCLGGLEIDQSSNLTG